MAGASNTTSFDVSPSASRSANVTHETLSALRASAYRNLESSLMTDIGDRRSIDMDSTRFSSGLPNLTFADQFQAARNTLSMGSVGNETFGGLDPAEMTQTFTQAHLGLLLDEDPGWKATEALFDDFLRFLLLFPGQHQVFELLRHYEELCLDQILILRKIIERGAPGKQRFIRTVEMLRYMEAELWTWRLIRLLYEDRLKPTDQETRLTEDQVRLLSDLEKWNYLYETDPGFREMRLIVQWCQQNAFDLLDVRDPGNMFGEKTFLWENTLHRLKSGKDSSARRLVKSMDPDAPIRGGAHMDDTDEADEQRLLSLVFCYVRAGQLEKAVDTCVNAGQSWRGSTLKAALPYNRRGGQLNGEVSGNASRDVWKRMAWQLCDNPALPPIERAIYGSLSGHFVSMRSLCGSWEDILWAHATAASEHAFDNFLRQTASDKKRKLTQLPQQSSVNEEAGKLTLEEIVRTLETSEDEKIAEESKTVFRRLQAFAFLNNPADAVLYMHDYLREYGNDVPKHLIRLMAHIVLVFKLCALDVPIALANGILEHYVKVLIEDERAELIAFYTATLPEGSQTAWYAKFLEAVEGKEKRRHYLSLAEKARLDVASICIAVVYNLRRSFEPTVGLNQSFLSSTSSSGVEEGLEDQSTLVAAAMTADVSERDLRLVGAVEWLLFDPALHGEAVQQANAISRVLLIGRNLAAVQKLFASLPPDLLQTATDAWLNADGKGRVLEHHQLSIENRNAIREFECHQAYLEAHATFRRWFEHFHRKKPQIPSLDMADSGVVTGVASFRQRAAAEMKGRQYEEKLKEWERDVQALADDASLAAFHVLLYPHGGWMVDQATRPESMDDTLEQDRVAELILLRKRCLPLIADMVITVLQGSRRFKDAMKMADIIVSEEYRLYEVFSKDQLKHVNRRLAEVSIEAMNDGHNCIGLTDL